MSEKPLSPRPTYELIDNEAARRYEFHLGEHKPRIEYIKVAGKIYLTHTEVPPALEGQGIGSAIIKAALEEADRNDWTLIPLCPFVAAYIKRHPEWRRLVLKGINIE